MLEEAQNSFLQDKDTNIPKEAIKFHLDTLKEKGYIESRISQHQERESTKKSQHELEYKLTDDGLRMSIRYSPAFFISPEGSFEPE